MKDLVIGQSVFIGTEVVGRSPGFGDPEAAARLVLAYGTLPVDVEAVFTGKLTQAVMAVVQARGNRFRILAIPRRLYLALHDPLRVAVVLPANYEARGELPDLTWVAGPAPQRTVDDIRTVLKTRDGPTLLGAAQALVDGGRVAVVRPTPDPAIIEAIWTLLPDSTRADLSVATFALRNELRFGLIVTPSADGEEFTDYLPDRHAGDYPEGRYELALQTAAETGDSAALGQLFYRRSAAASMRLAVTMLAAAVGMGLALRLIPWERLR